MKNQPDFPLILIDNSGYLSLSNSADDLSTASVVALSNNFHKNLRAYGQNHTLWTITNVDSSYKLTILTKFLAHTFYNPRVRVILTWAKSDFKLAELKKDIKRSIDKDDDVLTQFEEAPIINSAIDSCESFHDVLYTLNKYIFDIDEQVLEQEQNLRERNGTQQLL